MQELGETWTVGIGSLSFKNTAQRLLPFTDIIKEYSHKIHT